MNTRGTGRTMTKIRKVEIQAVSDEENRSYTMNLVTFLDDNEEPMIDYMEFVNRDVLEAGVAETVEYMNKHNYDYEKYFMVVRE